MFREINQEEDIITVSVGVVFPGLNSSGSSLYLFSEEASVGKRGDLTSM
jgi:hypothetical protein